MWQFYNPVPGAVISQSFEEHKQNAIESGCCWRPGKNCSCYYYPGVDLADNSAPSVGNAIKGKVIFADWDKATLENPKRGYGLQVRVSGTFGLMIYAHLSKINVRLNDVIEPGVAVGQMGSTGYSSGLHTHWEWRVGGIPTDPWPYVVAQQPPVSEPPPALPPPPYEPPSINGILYPLVCEKWKVIQYVYIRSAPGTDSPMVGDLYPGDIIIATEGIELNPYSVWVKHPKGWSAFYHGTPPICYLRPHV